MEGIGEFCRFDGKRVKQRGRLQLARAAEQTDRNAGAVAQSPWHPLPQAMQTTDGCQSSRCVFRDCPEVANQNSGIKVYTDPHNVTPIRQIRIARFDGKAWVLFADVLGER